MSFKIALEPTFFHSCEREFCSPLKLRISNTYKWWRWAGLKRQPQGWSIWVHITALPLTACPASGRWRCPPQTQLTARDEGDKGRTLRTNICSVCKTHQPIQAHSRYPVYLQYFLYFYILATCLDLSHSPELERSPQSASVCELNIACRISKQRMLQPSSHRITTSQMVSPERTQDGTGSPPSSSQPLQSPLSEAP